ESGNRSAARSRYRTRRDCTARMRRQRSSTAAQNRHAVALLWLKNVPWATILANAPGIVDGAKKLASAMRSKPAPTDTRPDPPAGQDPVARLVALEEQQRAAAELLRALADQNAEMVQALAALRERARIHLRIAVGALIAALAALMWSILR